MWMVINSCPVQIENACWIIFELLRKGYFCPAVVKQCVAAPRALLMALYLHPLSVMEQTAIWSSLHCQKKSVPRWSNNSACSVLTSCARVIAVDLSSFPPDECSFPPPVNISSVLPWLMFSRHHHHHCCCTSSWSSSSSVRPRAASIQQQRRRTAVCAENRGLSALLSCSGRLYTPV